jgi:hypothetical protein
VIRAKLRVVSLALVGLSASLITLGPSCRSQGFPQSGGDFSQNPQAKKLPVDTILVKGAWSSASDSTTPVPEGGTVGGNLYTNKYFELTYPLPPEWTQKYSGPPPSDSGYYVLAQLRPADAYKGKSHASVLIAAQDLFFTLTPATNALELINYVKEQLNPDYKVERPPTPVSIGDRSFLRFDYSSPVAELHWYVLATQIRCHLVQFVFTSQDTKLIESLVQDLNKISLPAEASPIAGTGGNLVPVCIKDYAHDENILEREDPIFTERRFNTIPVRIIVDKEGKVKHVHFLSAFPDQAKAITDALAHWRFKPYAANGQPAEVETGIVFGHPPRRTVHAAGGAVSE